MSRLFIVTLSVIMLNDVMPSVVAPPFQFNQLSDKTPQLILAATPSTDDEKKVFQL
jgi:hypothetical protein